MLMDMIQDNTIIILWRQKNDGNMRSWKCNYKRQTMQISDNFSDNEN